MATFTVDQISVYFNNVKLPLISGDDAVSVPSPFSYDTMVNDMGGVTASKKIDAIKINKLAMEIKEGKKYLSSFARVKASSACEAGNCATKIAIVVVRTMIAIGRSFIFIHILG